MSDLFELTAQTRTQVGTSASRRLRREAGLVPGIIYGDNKPPVKLMFKQHELFKAMAQDAFFSHILTIHTEKTQQQAVIKSLQRHPTQDLILHVDFLRVDVHKKLVVRVPLHFTGEQLAPGVKNGGVIDRLMNDIEIRCFANDLPESIAVDLAHLELNKSLYLSDIPLPKGVELSAAREQSAHNTVVVTVSLVKTAARQDNGTSQAITG